MCYRTWSAIATMEMSLSGTITVMGKQGAAMEMSLSGTVRVMGSWFIGLDVEEHSCSWPVHAGKAGECHHRLSTCSLHVCTCYLLYGPMVTIFM